MTSIVALHGFTGGPDDWQPIAASLSSRATWSAPTLCGHDPARDDHEVTTFEGELDRLTAWLDRQEAARPFLLGYSLGARIGLGLLARHPTRFVGAVLIGARGGPPGDEATRSARARSDEAWAASLEAEGIEAFVTRWEHQPVFASQASLPRAVRQQQRRRRLAHRPTGLARALRSLGWAHMPDLVPALAAVRTPVRLLVGALDGPFRDAASGLAWHVSTARVTVVPNVGHNLILEAPHAVAAALLEELDRCQT